MICRVFKLAAVAGLSLLLAGCASSGSSKPKALSEKHRLVLVHAGDPVRSVTVQTVRDYEVLDDYALLIWERQSRAYLLGLDPTCTELRWVHAIELLRQEPWLNAGMDAVRAGQQRCVIRTIRVVDGKALKAARKQSKAKD